MDIMNWQRQKTVTLFLCYQNRHLYQFPLFGRKCKAENYAKTGIRDITASSHSIYFKIDSKDQVIHKLASQCITHDISSSRSGPTVHYTYYQFKNVDSWIAGYVTRILN